MHKSKDCIKPQNHSKRANDIEERKFLMESWAFSKFQQRSGIEEDVSNVSTLIQYKQLEDEEQRYMKSVHKITQ
jgi:hypothetical protein